MIMSPSRWLLVPLIFAGCTIPLLSSEQNNSQADGGSTDGGSTVVITSTEQTRAALLGKWRIKDGNDWHLVFAEKADGTLTFAFFIDGTCQTATSTSISGCPGVSERPVTVSGRVVSLQDQITLAVVGNAPRGGVSSTRKLTISTDGTFLTEYSWSIGWDSTVWHASHVWVKDEAKPNCQNNWECRSSTDGYSLSCGVQKVCAPIYCTSDSMCPPETRCDEQGEVSARPRICLGLPGWASCVADLTSNPDHCGACGHSCQGGACLMSKCQPVTLATVPQTFSVSQLWSTPSSVLLSGHGTDGVEIHRVPRNGGAVTKVLGMRTGSTTEDWMLGAPAFLSPHIYWIQARPQGADPLFESRLMRRNADTGTDEELGSGFFGDSQQISVSEGGVAFVQRLRGGPDGKGGFLPDTRRLSIWSATTRTITTREMFGDFAYGGQLFSTGVVRKASTGLTFQPYDGSAPRTFPGSTFGASLGESAGFWLWQGPTHPAAGGTLYFGPTGVSVSTLGYPIGGYSFAHLDVITPGPQLDAGPSPINGMPYLAGVLMIRLSAIMELSLSGMKQYIELPAAPSLLVADGRTVFIYVESDGTILGLAR